MEYTVKHKKLIAKLFKKAGMLEEADIVLSCDEYKLEIAKAMRDVATKADVPIGSTPVLLDAARRYETRNCVIFKECTLLRCEGGVWCNIYNLGGSHGRIGDGYRLLGKSAFDVPLPDRRKLMLEMLEYQTRHKPDIKGTKGTNQQDLIMNYWRTSDYHFSHFNIIRYCKRPGIIIRFHLKKSALLFPRF